MYFPIFFLLAGIAFFIFRDRIPELDMKGWLRWGAAAASAAFLLNFMFSSGSLGDALAGVAGAIFVAWGVWFFFFRTPANADQWMRGGQIVQQKTLQKLAKQEDPKAEIFVGGVGIPRKMENRHFLLSGSTGSGKSQAFYQIAEVARKRGDAGVAADVNGEMLSRFYSEKRGDVILNPLDTRSQKWSPLSEIAGVWDADRIAKSLIPQGHGSAAEWNHYAGVLTGAALAKIWQEDGKNHDLTSLLLSASNEELAEKLAGTDAAQLFAPGAERMLSSIRAITATYLKPLSYLSPEVGRDGFSISKFIKNECEKKSGRWLFLPARDDFFKTFKSLVAAQIDIAISALLSAPDDEARRVWFLLDEFASWGKIESIDGLLTKARKKGGVGVLGLQSISQIRESYGKEGAQTLLANLGNWLTLRAGDAETAEFMSRNIGDEQVKRTNENRDKDNKKSTSQQVANQRSVMAPELQNLADLQGILNIAGPLPAGWVTVPVSNLKRVAEPFEMVNL